MTSRACPFPHDDIVPFLREGYLFTGKRRREVTHADDDRPLWLRVMGKPALLLRGADGVRLFYDASKVKRSGAMPAPIQGSLFGNGSVHSLDDEAHLHRKKTFVAVCYDDAQVERIKPMIEAEVREAMQRWAKHPESVYDSMVIAYGRASLRWAGIEGRDADLDVQATRLGEIVEGFAHPNLDHAKAWVNRRLTNRWCAQVIGEQRSGKRNAEPGTSLHAWATFRELDGTLLDEKTAGLEMQNTFRPHIAVARFAAFATKALFERPEWRERIQAETAERGTLVDGPLATAFAQEVRRYYPFVPVLPAFARTDFEFEGEKVSEGDRLLIDILNTNTGPSWERADEFDPERFLGVDFEQIVTFIPQGGSDVETTHRCPGEKIAVSSLATTIAALCEPGVEILPDGLDFSWREMPTRPTSGGLVTLHR
ncbi:cytochrome P450 [Propioniciclava soli]|uniref:cytochrome P450 n=1 Tax=Propioniciclava soli TaxID=2775081 RepID=UPI001E3C689E|nr:cytochrome P450 [Propioniciclava soli]